MIHIPQGLFDEIVRRILGVCTPHRIIVFGSAAAGTMGPDSDIDLLIVEASVHDVRAESVKVRAALRGLGFPFDVIVVSQERFEETRNLVGSIAYPADKRGIVVYEAA